MFLTIEFRGTGASILAVGYRNASWIPSLMALQIAMLPLLPEVGRERRTGPVEQRRSEPAV